MSGMFEFVTVNHPEEAREKKKQKRIRQHAIRSGLQSKRSETAKRNDNFVAVEIDPHSGKVRPRKDTNALVNQVSGHKLDPFETLPGSSEQLHMLTRYSTLYPT